MTNSFVIKTYLDQLMFSTVRIETDDAQGKRRAATGVVFELEVEENKYPFLVTTHSAVMHAQSGRVTFFQEIRGTPVIDKGYTLDIDNFDKLWYAHPGEDVDLAITPFVPFIKHIEESGVPTFFHAIGAETLLSEQELTETMGIEDVLLVGYLSSVWDPKHVLPIVRRGNLAVPGRIAWGGQRHMLIDMPLHAGLGGSPVFLQRDRQDMSTESIQFLGILAAANYFHRDPYDGANLAPMADLYQKPGQQTVNIGVVIHAHLVVEVVYAYLREKGFV